jgi:hypothetical protein
VSIRRIDDGAGVPAGPVVMARFAVGIPSKLKYVVPPLAAMAGLKATVPVLELEVVQPGNVDVGPA